MKMSGDSTRPCQSSTPTVKDCDLTLETDTYFWAGIWWLDGQ